MKKMILLTVIVLIVSSIPPVLADTNWSTSWTFSFEEESEEPEEIPEVEVGIGENVYKSQYETQAGWWNNDWSYYKQVTIDSIDQVTSTQTNIPILLNFTDSDLVDNALDNGSDIAFTLIDNSTQLNHEIESFNGTTGALIAWVNITSLPHDSDLKINMYYGNAGASNQEHITDTWDSHYVSVWHCNASTGELYDSTAYNKNTIAVKGAPSYQQTGKIGYGVSLNPADGTDGFNIPADYGIFAGLHNYTLESWYTTLNVTSSQRLFSLYGEALVIFWLDGATENDPIAFYTRIDAWDILSSDGYPTGTWTYAVATRHTTNGKGLYLNGALANSNAWTGSQASRAEVNSIGCNGVTPNDGLDGSIDEFRISDVARSTDWLNVCYNTINNASTSAANPFISLGSEQSQAVSTPTVTTNSAIGVEETNATLSGTLTSNGEADTTCYFLYGDENPPTDNNVSQGVIANGATFTYNWQSLTQGKLYFVDTAANNSVGWDSSGGVIGFLTKPNAPTSLINSSITDGINLSWTHGTGYNHSILVRKTTGYSTTPTDGTEIYNGTHSYYEDTPLPGGTYYYRVWEYAQETYNPTLHQFSDGNTSMQYEAQAIFTSYATLTFGGKLNVTNAIKTDISPGTWTGGTPSCGASITGNFTFYQNGSGTIDTTIGCNATNYAFVTYATWAADGEDQWYANFTTNSWGTETNIDAGYPPTTSLNSSVPGSTSFPFGVRIGMPKTVRLVDVQEDFIINTQSTVS